MSQDFPTFAEVGERNTKMRDFKQFQRMMKHHPIDYHAYPPRKEPE